MDPMLLFVLQTHVLDQCRAALRGLAEMDAGLEDVQEDDGDRFWHGCQAALGGAANVSKLLWGIGGKGAAERLEQRRPLRESLRVSDESPLRSVVMRNNFEHLDERLLTWWDQSPRHNIVDRIVGTGDLVSGLEDREKFRQYEPQSGELVFWGERFSMRGLGVALTTLSEQSKLALSTPWWGR